MALFGSNKKSDDDKAPVKAAAVAPEKKEKKAEAPKQTAASSVSDISLPKKDAGHVIVRPRITEKATTLAESNVYAFEVAINATKPEIVKAIKDLYKVTPVKIRTIKHKPEKYYSRMRNRRGVLSGYKKAYVYLKEGDRIEIV